MAIDARAIVSMGFLPTSSAKFAKMVLTKGWWSDPIIPPSGVLIKRGGSLSIEIRSSMRI
jgi:hypothetical protein